MSVHTDRIRCEYCGRVNSIKNFHCDGCGAGLMPELIKQDTVDWKRTNEYNRTIAMLWASSDGGMSYSTEDPDD